MRRIWRLIPILCLAACAANSPRSLVPGDPDTKAALSDGMIVGEEFDYVVRRGDTLLGIGARFAVDAGTLASRNGIAVRSRLRPGQVLRVDNRHIVPRVLEDGIVINIPQRLLFHFAGGRLAGWYPAGLGQPGSWGTPTGSYEIVTREKDPVWDVPVSIQREMRRKGERVRRKVPPGPDNPLGEHWLGLSLTCCGIHGTNAPQSVYRFQTHGCIRLQPQNAEELFSRVAVGLPVEIIYEPVLVARDRSGATFLEVHPDVYDWTSDHPAAARQIAESRGYRNVWRSAHWEQTLRAAEGVAVPLRTATGDVATSRRRTLAR